MTPALTESTAIHPDVAKEPRTLLAAAWAEVEKDDCDDATAATNAARAIDALFPEGGCAMVGAFDALMERVEALYTSGDGSTALAVAEVRAPA